MKIGRNELCPCKSGKKHKKCCLHVMEDMKNEQTHSVDVSYGEFLFNPEVNDAANRLLMRLNHGDEVSEVKKEAAQLNELYPDRPEVKFAQAACCLQEENGKEAIPHLEAAVALFPLFSEALYYLGLLYLNEERIFEGVACLERVIKIDSPLDHFRILARKELEELETVIAKETGLSLEHYVKNKQLIDQAADYLKQDKYEHAILLFQEILTRNADDAAASFGLSVAYAKLGKEELAQEYFLKAYTLDPSFISFMDEVVKSEKDIGDDFGYHAHAVDQSQQFLSGI